ncbi:MAG: hypothetical protein M0R38_05580 [Bacteroidia bacterium]|nr:hypothetical protein [Bacteroidia bacterium]
MKSYPAINFISFSIIETCDFVSERLHVDIANKMNSINNAFLENEDLFANADNEHTLSILFIQMKNECEKLMRLESFVFLPFLKKKILEKDFTLPEPAVDKLYHYQNLILTLLLRIKQNMHGFNTGSELTSIEQIVMNDLVQLEFLMADWTNIVRERIVQAIKNKLSDNEFA